MTDNDRAKYLPSTGGHAPEYLREAYCNALGTVLAYLEAVTDDLDVSAEFVRTVQVGDEVRTVRWVTGQLWNCTDTMPDTITDRLYIPHGSNYAVGARELKHLLEIAERWRSGRAAKRR